MTKEEKNQMKVETKIVKTMAKYARKYGGDVVLRALRNVINDLNKVIEEKKFDDKGAHHVSSGFYYARKELEKMKGI